MSIERDMKNSSLGMKTLKFFRLWYNKGSVHVFRTI